MSRHERHDPEPRDKGASTGLVSEAGGEPNWSKPCSRTEAAASLGISTDNLNDYLADHPDAVVRVTRQKWQFDRNFPLFKSLP